MFGGVPVRGNEGVNITDIAHCDNFVLPIEKTWILDGIKPNLDFRRSTEQILTYWTRRDSQRSGNEIRQ